MKMIDNKTKIKSNVKSSLKSNLKTNRIGFVNILELILTAIALFTVFAILFPETGYKSSWDYASLLVRGRDVALAADGIGKAYEYSFNRDSFNVFLDSLFGGTNIITWHTTSNAVKSTVKIACACSSEQMQALSNWLQDVKINGRSLDFIIYQSSLTSIVPSDVLLIWGYRDLSSYRSSIESYLSTGSGAVEIMDFTADVGSVQREIFGITNGGGWGNDVDYILKPSTGEQLTYQTYKIFYHLPYRLRATENAELTAACVQSNKTGSFAIRSLSPSRQFWICDGTSVYFDTNGNGNEDTGALHAGDSFTIDGFNFRVAYIESAEQIRVKFENSPEYKFADFIRASAIEKIKPSNDDYSRALVCRENPQPQKTCGVILNNASAWRTAWMADFTRSGLSVGDDLKQLLTVLLLWASDKDETTSISNLRVGYATSFVNVRDRDTFELYNLNFGIGYPY